MIVILFILAVLIVPLGLVIWNVVDVSKWSDAAFEKAGQQRMVWLVLRLALMVIGLGWIVSAVYFLAIRPKVIAATSSCDRPLLHGLGGGGFEADTECKS